MKKVFVCLALGIALCLTTVSGYAETKSPVKQQTELFVGSVEFP